MCFYPVPNRSLVCKVDDDDDDDDDDEQEEEEEEEEELEEEEEEEEVDVELRNAFDGILLKLGEYNEFLAKLEKAVNTSFYIPLLWVLFEDELTEYLKEQSEFRKNWVKLAAEFVKKFNNIPDEDCVEFRVVFAKFYEQVMKIEFPLIWDFFEDKVTELLKEQREFHKNWDDPIAVETEKEECNEFHIEFAEVYEQQRKIEDEFHAKKSRKKNKKSRSKNKKSRRRRQRIVNGWW